MSNESTTSKKLTVRDNALQEGSKLYYDTFKHLTTLSTGSILLLATFLTDVFDAPEWTNLIGWVFASFILSIVSSVIVMTSLSYVVISEKLPAGAAILFGLNFLTAALGFLSGVILLSLFALKNFY
jgi:hypothetical protein